MSEIPPIEQLLAVRESPLLWFQGFGRYCDEQTRQPVRGRANVLQRRMFEHYRRCRVANKPCRMAVLKYRRAGSSTGSEALIYTHAHNFNARLGVVGTDYKASSNMLEMLKFFGEHDDFPGWGARARGGKEKAVTWQEWFGGANLESVPFADRVDKIIQTRIEWSHGSVAELYTASNPESARSAGLNGYHATECARWQTGGALDAGETLMSMRNTLPKAGFHIAIEESTANGAQGAFYDTCRRARWPEYAPWVDQFKSSWDLKDVEFGRDLQFVFIFAAWYEDARHVDTVTPEQEQRIRDTLDEDEKKLIAQHGQDGPRGQRLGSEVDATVWEQLAWRRGIIETVCTKRGRDEFAQEYPSNPLEAFRSSGSPVFDSDGIISLDEGLRVSTPPEIGGVDTQRDGSTAWRRSKDGMLVRWEQPIEGCRYVISVDNIENSEVTKGEGVRDCNAVLVLRDAYTDIKGVGHPLKLVARVATGNRWDDAPLASLIAPLAKYYGDCLISVENNKGAALIIRLRDEYHCRLYFSEHWDAVKQRPSTTYGWRTDVASRRQMVATGQEYIREQIIDIFDPNLIAEIKAFVFDTHGKACAASGCHDDEVMALLLGLCTIHAATAYPKRPIGGTGLPPDAHAWR